MQKFRPYSASKICLTLLGLTLLTQTVFGNEYDKVSYLDSVSSSYVENNQTLEPAILNANSIEAKGFEATFRLDSSPVITNSQTRVNLSLRDSDLKQTLRMIADKAGLNIVFDQSVTGKITLDLNNVTLNDAFLIIFKSSQLSYNLDGNTITVLTLDAARNIAYTRQNMTILPIKYVNADAVAEFLNENLFKSNIFGLSNQPIVTSNPRTNQIVVFGNMSDVNAIKRILPVIDTKPMVNSFKVNHTTPEEMANLVCSSLIYNKEATQASSTKKGGEDKLALGAGYVACRDEGDTESQSSNEGLKAFKSNPLTVVYFPDLGTINTYGGSVEQVETIKTFIKEHDKKQLMAYIELSVIELTDSGSKEFSNKWSLWTPFINLSFTPSDGLQTRGASLDGWNIWDSNSSSNNKALLYELKYLISNEKGRVLTNPKIMVTNGKKAVIDMTEDYVKSVTSQILQGSDTVTSATQRTYDIGSDQGLLIEILPFISPDGYVSMNITPEFATEKSQVFADNGTGAEELVATLLQRRDLELKNIRVRDGETLILAGLIKETDMQTTKKMPVLSDLPLIGVFFRGNNSTKTRSELVIVVTPHIVKDGKADTEEQVYDL